MAIDRPRIVIGPFVFWRPTPERPVIVASGSNTVALTGVQAAGQLGSFNVGFKAAQYLEMELSGRGNGWTAVTDYLRESGLVWHRGFPGNGITDVVSDTGTLQFTLDNSEKNSAGKVGYYSADNANLRPGFKIGIGVRVRLRVGVTDYIRWTGVLDSADPVPGILGPRTVQCEALTWMDRAARMRLAELPVQVDATGDEVFQTLIDSVSLAAQPLAVEKDPSADVYPYTLDRTRDEQTVMRDELYRLAVSGLDRIWERGNGTLVYESRSRRALTRVDADFFMNDNHGFVPRRERSDIINKVQGTVHPRKIGTAHSVMYALDRVIALTPGNPVPILGPWTDPSNPDVRVGAVTLDTVTATTDYTANTQEDGGGTDLTSFVTVGVGLSGNATKFTITLGGGTPGFLTKLQQRGTPLLDYGATVSEWENTSSIDEHGLLVDRVDMPYQDDPNFGLEVAQYFVFRRAAPRTEVGDFTRLVSMTNDAELARNLQREISDRVQITDTVTGISKSFFINAIDETVGDGWVQTVWSLAIVDLTAYWLLEVVGRSELDQTTVLGFGLIVGHVDVPHGDTHGDVAHTDDSTHEDVGHGDTSHSDSHSDSAHGDVGHGDSHTDVHGDHDDVTGHGDGHSDGWTHYDSHGDGHGDSAHSDTPHDDGWHSDHSDSPIHGDHNDVGGPFHQDTNHSDVAHSDTAHTDTHTDYNHYDYHSDVAHDDSHTDSAHGDSHGDVAHTDAPHSDVNHHDSAHTDSHTDTDHGDAN